MRYVITGIAGFIGSNLAERLIGRGDLVLGVDDLSRRGARENLSRLQGLGSFRFEQGDVSDWPFMDRVFASAGTVDAVVHLAGQVAVTTSVVNPRADFRANALGTFNALEAVRIHVPGATFLYSSTNKVYGKMADVPVVDCGGRYAYAELARGVAETQPLEFHSPYGCSKGSGDQYVVDYARIYGLKTVSLRQSCIYGYNQFGIEDQGWVAWLTIASILDRPITVYGDGKQVRDILFIDDLLDAYDLAIDRSAEIAGDAFNIGGGPEQTMSLLELLGILERRLGRPLRIEYADWRPGDQKVFVCNIDKARRSIGWVPKTSVDRGVDLLFSWCEANVDRFRRLLV